LTKVVNLSNKGNSRFGELMKSRTSPDGTLSKRQCPRHRGGHELPIVDACAAKRAWTGAPARFFVPPLA
jgi:hypothetical protein